MDLNVGTRLKALDGPILVTGHTGFKGTWLTRYLRALGAEVVGFSLPPLETDLFTRANLRGAINECFSDIRNFDAVKSFIDETKPSAIFHLAAQPLVLESYRDPIGTFQTNVMGTANILEAARRRESNIAVVVVTTDKVYENRNTGARFKETDSLLGRDPYSASKVGTENVAIAWSQLASEDKSLNISVTRSGNVIGGGDLSDNRLLPDVVRAHLSKNPLEIRSPLSTRPWQHVLDPLRGYILTLNKAIVTGESDVFNFGPTEDAVSVEEVLGVVRENWRELNYKIHVPVDAYYESRFLDLDSNHARQKLLWKPIYSQHEAITATILWWDSVIAKRTSTLEAIDQQILDYLKLCAGD